MAPGVFDQGLSVTMSALLGVRTQRLEDAETQKNCLITATLSTFVEWFPLSLQQASLPYCLITASLSAFAVSFGLSWSWAYRRLAAVALAEEGPRLYSDLSAVLSGVGIA
jgi:hypothetical protein